MDSIQRLIREMVSDADIIDGEYESWLDGEAPLSYEEFVALIWEIYNEYVGHPAYEDYSPERLVDIVEDDLIWTLKEKFETYVYVCGRKYNNERGYVLDKDNAARWYKDYKKKSEKVWDKVYDSLIDSFSEDDY